MNRIFGLRALARSYITWRRECDEQRAAADARRAAAELTEAERQAIRDTIGIVDRGVPYHFASG